MKHIKYGNIFSVKSGIIVHGCNSKGVMGSGMAKQVRELYPKAYEAYKAHEGHYYLGQLILASVTPTLIICNAITQADYGRDPSAVYVSYNAVQRAFRQLAAHAAKFNEHVHYPQIGAGLGNGDWNKLDTIIDEEFEKHPEVERTLWIYRS